MVVVGRRGGGELYRQDVRRRLRLFYPHVVRQSGKLNLIHPLLHVLFIGDMAESGGENFLAAANNNPFRAQSSMEYISE